MRQVPGVEAEVDEGRGSLVGGGQHRMRLSVLLPLKLCWTRPPCIPVRNHKNDRFLLSLLHHSLYERSAIQVELEQRPCPPERAQIANQ